MKFLKLKDYLRNLENSLNIAKLINLNPAIAIDAPPIPVYGVLVSFICSPRPYLVYGEVLRFWAFTPQKPLTTRHSNITLFFNIIFQNFIQPFQCEPTVCKDAIFL